MAQPYSYFEHDDAHFRRDNSRFGRSVHDVLQDGKWVPYRGRDPLAPATFGTPCQDPLAANETAI